MPGVEVVARLLVVARSVVLEKEVMLAQIFQGSLEVLLEISYHNLDPTTQLEDTVVQLYY